MTSSFLLVIFVLTCQCVFCSQTNAVWTLSPRGSEGTACGPGLRFFSREQNQCDLHCMGSSPPLGRSCSIPRLLLADRLVQTRFEECWRTTVPLHTAPAALTAGIAATAHHVPWLAALGSSIQVGKKEQQLWTAPLPWETWEASGCQARRMGHGQLLAGAGVKPQLQKPRGNAEQREGAACVHQPACCRPVSPAELHRPALKSTEIKGTTLCTSSAAGGGKSISCRCFPFSGPNLDLA